MVTQLMLSNVNLPATFPRHGHLRKAILLENVHYVWQGGRFIQLNNFIVDINILATIYMVYYYINFFSKVGAVVQHVIQI